MWSDLYLRIDLVLKWCHLRQICFKLLCHFSCLDDIQTLKFNLHSILHNIAQYLKLKPFLIPCTFLFKLYVNVVFNTFHMFQKWILVFFIYLYLYDVNYSKILQVTILTFFILKYFLCLLILMYRHACIVFPS